MSQNIPNGFGWIPDIPDYRDYTFRDPNVLPILRNLGQYTSQLPASVDLRTDDEGEYFLAPKHQGLLNSSSAFAVASLFEYFERRIAGKTFGGSELFIYKLARMRMRVAGDVGASLRSTLKMLVNTGAPSELDWSYNVELFDVEPSPFLFSVANPFDSVVYFRLDEPNTNGSEVLAILKSFLAAGFPVSFGFSVPSSLTDSAEIPFRRELDSVQGGQAAVAVGYRDKFSGTQQDALLIRNSWGTQWGDNGYGWLPVSYVTHKLARDFWTLIDNAWVASPEVHCPTVVASIFND